MREHSSGAHAVHHRRWLCGLERGVPRALSRFGGGAGRAERTADPIRQGSAGTRPPLRHRQCEDRAGMCLSAERHIGSRAALNGRLVSRAGGYAQNGLATNQRRLSVSSVSAVLPLPALPTTINSLYDALVSINVPTDKAKAVVDAMERDMTTLLASKSDIAMLRQDLDGARVATKSDIAMLRQDLDGGRLETKNDIAMLRQDLETTRTLFSKDLELLRSSKAIRLGSMLIVGLGILFTALKLT